METIFIFHEKFRSSEIFQFSQLSKPPLEFFFIILVIFEWNIYIHNIYHWNTFFSTWNRHLVRFEFRYYRHLKKIDRFIGFLSVINSWTLESVLEKVSGWMWRNHIYVALVNVDYPENGIVYRKAPNVTFKKKDSTLPEVLEKAVKYHMRSDVNLWM